MRAATTALASAQAPCAKNIALWDWRPHDGPEQAVGVCCMHVCGGAVQSGHLCSSTMLLLKALEVFCVA